MKATVILAILGLAVSSSAAAAVAAGPSARCNVTGNGTTPQLYHEYGVEVCHAKYRVDNAGYCLVPSQQKQANETCGGFCQTNTTFTYLAEVPILDSVCRGPGDCVLLANTTIRTVHCDSTITGAELGIVRVGVDDDTFGRLDSVGASVVSRQNVNLGKDECGYYAFLPIGRTVCGTLTETASIGCRVLETDPHFCATELLATFQDHSQAGRVVFVRSDCKTGMRLCTEEQPDPAYRMASAALGGGDNDTGISTTLAAAATAEDKREEQAVTAPVKVTCDISLASMWQDLFGLGDLWNVWAMGSGISGPALGTDNSAVKDIIRACVPDMDAHWASTDRATAKVKTPNKDWDFAVVGGTNNTLDQAAYTSALGCLSEGLRRLTGDRGIQCGSNAGQAHLGPSRVGQEE